MSRPRRVTCPCGRTFVTEDRVTECADCRAYAKASVVSMLPRSGRWLPPSVGCDLPRKGPWRPDDDEEGGLA